MGFFFTLSNFFILFTSILIGLAIIPRNEIEILRLTGLLGSFLVFFFSLIFAIQFNDLLLMPQFNVEYNLFYVYSITFAVDSLSLYLIILTTLIFFLCFLSSFTSITKDIKKFVILFFFLEFVLILVFTVLDFFFFYILFETSLIPMFLLIGAWGSKERKTKAAYYLFLYTLCGSMFMLIAMLIIFSQVGNTAYYSLLTTELSPIAQFFIWPAIFFAFAVKIPMFPFHLWLPEAHVEAPTIGSVLLAGIILKLGGYAFCRYLLPLYPIATSYYLPFAFVLAILGAVYSTFTALRQIDMKRIIAYSSIAHMNMGLVGLFTGTLEGFCGFYYVMLGHGFISSALFFLVGVLYERYHTRIYYYYSGLALRMPLFAIFFFLFSIANIAFPGTINFVSELLLLIGTAKYNFIILIVCGLSLLGSTFYTMWLYNRIAFGTLTSRTAYFWYDLTKMETFVFVCLGVLTLIGGWYPQPVLSVIAPLYFFLF